MTSKHIPPTALLATLTQSEVLYDGRGQLVVPNHDFLETSKVCIPNRVKDESLKIF